MTTDQQTALQLAARKLAEAQGKLSEAYRVASMVAPHTLYPSLHALGDTLNELGEALTAAGAMHTPTAPTTDPDGLEALRRIEESRTQGRVLLQVLEEALIRAEQLDKRRGNWVGDQADTLHGETPGTGYAEAIQAIFLRLRGELGPEGEGR